MTSSASAPASKLTSPMASVTSPTGLRGKQSGLTYARLFALIAVLLFTILAFSGTSIEGGLKDLDFSFLQNRKALDVNVNPEIIGASDNKSLKPSRPDSTNNPAKNRDNTPTKATSEATPQKKLVDGQKPDTTEKSWFENLKDGVQQLVGGGGDTDAQNVTEKQFARTSRPVKQSAADLLQKEYVSRTKERFSKGLDNRKTLEEYERAKVAETVNAPAAKAVPRSMVPYQNPPGENYPLEATRADGYQDTATKAVWAEDPTFPFEVKRAGDSDSSTMAIPPPVTVVEDEDGVEWEAGEYLDTIGVAQGTDEAELVLANKRVTLIYPSERIPPEDADLVAIKGSIWNELKLNYRNAPLSKISSDGERSRCLISAIGSANCDYYFESLEQCIGRHGADAIGPVLAIKCVDSKPWRESLSKLKSFGDYELWAEKRESQRGESVAEDGTTATRAKKYVPNPLVTEEAAKWRLQTILKTSRVQASEVCDATFRKNASAKAPLMTAFKSYGKLPLIVDDHNPRPAFVPQSRRFVPPYGEPRICQTGAYQYPIAFGTPKRNVQRHPFPKLFDFTPVPVSSHMNQRVVGYNDEDFNQALGQLSYYCLTHARGGWDCGRHHEILGSGCVPYFLDVPAMPTHILSHFPTTLFRDIVTQPAMARVGHIPGANGDNFRTLTANSGGLMSMGNSHHGRSQVMFPYDYDNVVSFDHSKHNETQYWAIARRLLKFSQKFATSEAMVSYILNTMGIAETTKKILFLSRGTWDNMGLSFLTGANGLGIEVTYVTGENNQNVFYCIEPDAPDGMTKADITTRFGTLTSKRLEGKRNDMNRIGVHGGGLPWANRIRGGQQMLKFVPNIESLPMDHDERPFPMAQNDTNITSTSEKLEAPPAPQSPAVNKDLAARLRPFDAIVFGFTRERHEWMREYASIKPGKVAVLDFQDSVQDPEGGADEVARHVYYFSRELRRLQC